MGTSFTDELGAANEARRINDDARCAQWLDVAPQQLIEAVRAMANEIAETIAEEKNVRTYDTRYRAALRFGIDSVIKQTPGFKDPQVAESVRRGLVRRYLND